MATDIIHSTLDGVKQQFGVRILYAAESGSRAWGFASADSDYDVRFVYARPFPAYVTIAKDRRDVIELPPWRQDGMEFDINGWDIDKALRLLRNGNPNLLEWLYSPVPYVTLRREWLRNLAERCFQPRAAVYHYLNMARGNYREYLKGDEVKLKKYLYVVRPLMVCDWLINKGSIPPVNFDELLNYYFRDRESSELEEVVKDLVKRKIEGEELATGPRVATINNWIERWMEEFETLVKDVDKKPLLTREELDSELHHILGMD
jgi:predicted nucleotidyltransferase